MSKDQFVTVEFKCRKDLLDIRPVTEDFTYEWFPSRDHTVLHGYSVNVPLVREFKVAFSEGED